MKKIDYQSSAGCVEASKRLVSLLNEHQLELLTELLHESWLHLNALAGANPNMCASFVEKANGVRIVSDLIVSASSLDVPKNQVKTAKQI